MLMLTAWLMRLQKTGQPARQCNKHAYAILQLMNMTGNSNLSKDVPTASGLRVGHRKPFADCAVEADQITDM